MAIIIISFPRMSDEDLETIEPKIRLAMKNNETFVCAYEPKVHYIQTHIPALITCLEGKRKRLMEQIKEAKDTGEPIFVNYSVSFIYLPCNQNPPTTVIA